MNKGISFSGKKLADLRREMFLAQEELARSMEMSKTRLSTIEGSDPAGMHPSNFRKLAEILKMPPDVLLKRIATDKASKMRAAAKPMGPRGPKP